MTAPGINVFEGQQVSGWYTSLDLRQVCLERRKMQVHLGAIVGAGCEQDGQETQQRALQS